MISHKNHIRIPSICFMFIGLMRTGLRIAFNIHNEILREIDLNVDRKNRAGSLYCTPTH